MYNSAARSTGLHATNTHYTNNSAMRVIDDDQQASTIEQDREMQMLDLINRVQMFQIASSRVNQNLLQRKKNPVFNLQFTETFEGQDEERAPSELEDLQSMLAASEPISKQHSGSLN